MPLYSYECRDCGAQQDAYRSVAERNDAPTCECGNVMVKIIAGYRVIGDMAPYYDENLETYVKSRQHRKEVMREKGVSEKFGKNWWTGASNKRRRA